MPPSNRRKTAPFLTIDPGQDLLFEGRYKIERLIGVGSAGTVHEALDVLTGVRVALKRMSADFSRQHNAQQLRERFHREALVLSTLRHPNIVRLFDYGEFENDRFYLVMEYLSGGSLLDILEDEDADSLSPAVVRDLAVQLCLALHEAHSRGVIHRDLKPDNIMLQPDTTRVGGKAIRLCDFGIAQLGPEWSKEKLTQNGALLGTVLYMSPEQAHGGALHASSDVYSVGCLVYEMLTGTPPFFFGSMVDILQAHAQEPLPPLECPGMDDERGELWYRALAAATAKDPARRPRTTLELAEVLANLPVEPLSTGKPPAVTV